MVKVCAIKAPGFGENRKANLQDLATLTGGEVLLLYHCSCCTTVITLTRFYFSILFSTYLLIIQGLLFDEVLWLFLTIVGHH